MRTNTNFMAKSSSYKFMYISIECVSFLEGITRRHIFTNTHTHIHIFIDTHIHTRKQVNILTHTLLEEHENRAKTFSQITTNLLSCMKVQHQLIYKFTSIMIDKKNTDIQSRLDLMSTFKALLKVIYRICKMFRILRWMGF